MDFEIDHYKARSSIWVGWKSKAQMPSALGLSFDKFKIGVDIVPPAPEYPAQNPRKFLDDSPKILKFEPPSKISTI